MKPHFSPALVLHWSLYGLIGFLVIGIGVGTYFLQSSLSGSVKELTHLKIDSEINDEDIQRATRLEVALGRHKEDIERAAAIVADTKYYQYQDQIVQDITSYASAAGLEITGFDFTAKSTATGGGISGIKTVVATVSLKTPIRYDDYLRFLKLIERNLTKMQVAKLDITVPSDLKQVGVINSTSIMIEVYVR